MSHHVDNASDSQYANVSGSSLKHVWHPLTFSEDWSRHRRFLLALLREECLLFASRRVVCISWLGHSFFNVPSFIIMPDLEHYLLRDQAQFASLFMHTPGMLQGVSPQSDMTEKERNHLLLSSVAACITPFSCFSYYVLIWTILLSGKNSLLYSSGFIRR